jgi:hypothetical protein
MNTYDYQSKTQPLLTDNISLATYQCNWCGRMYVERPFLCMCASNCFLRRINKIEHEQSKPRQLELL